MTCPWEGYQAWFASRPRSAWWRGRSGIGDRKWCRCPSCGRRLRVVLVLRLDDDQGEPIAFLCDVPPHGM